MAYTHIWFHISYTTQLHRNEINCKRADRDKAPVFRSYTFSPVSPIFSPVSPTFSPVSPLFSPVSLTFSPVSPLFSPVSPTFSPVSVEEKTWSCWHTVWMIGQSVWRLLFGRHDRHERHHLRRWASSKSDYSLAWPRTFLLELPSACVCVSHVLHELAPTKQLTQLDPTNPSLFAAFYIYRAGSQRLYLPQLLRYLGVYVHVCVGVCMCMCTSTRLWKPLALPRAETSGQDNGNQVVRFRTAFTDNYYMELLFTRRVFARRLGQQTVCKCESWC